MLEQLEKIQKEALEALDKVADPKSLGQWRSAHTGRKSPLMDVFTQMREMSKEERPQVGKRANEVRQALEKALEEKQLTLQREALASSLETEKLDVTLPGRPVQSVSVRGLLRSPRRRCQPPFFL